MSYRALFTADIHLSNCLPFAQRDPDTLVTDRLRDVLAVLEQMGRYADEHGITDIWVVGDLLDRRLLDAVTLKLAVDAVRELAEQHRVVLVPGNHEAYNATARHYTLEAFANLGEVPVVIGDGGWYDTVGPRIYALPYLPHARAVEVLSEMANSGDQPDLLLLHQTIKGGRVGKWESPDGLDPALLQAVCPAVLSGHFHTPQQIPVRGGAIAYLGAPLQHHFGDVGENRGFWDIDTASTEKAIKIPIEGAPRFHELRWITSGERPSVDEISQGDYVNLRLSGPKAAVDKLFPAAKQLCDWMVSEIGVRMAKPIPEPISGPTRQRIIDAKAGERPSVDVIIGRYLDTADCTGLNRQALSAIAKELVEDAEQ